MLIRELILHHVGDGAVHQRGYTLPPTQTPGLRLHSTEAGEALESGDLLLVSASRDEQLAEVLGDDLPQDTTVVLLIATEPAGLPVGRVVNALVGSGLKLIEAVVASGMRQPTVAVVARRTDDLVLPVPYVARELEPTHKTTSDQSTEVLTRILAESVLENLTQRARERELLSELGAAQDLQRTAERRQEELEALKALPEELGTTKSERDAIKAERDAVKKRLRQVESSTTYRLASRMAKVSGRVRRRAPRRGK